MKKLSILAAILAVGTMCVAGCNMGGANTAKTPAPETRNIVTQEESNEGEKAPESCPDGDCDGNGDCNRGKMPFAKPNFKFQVPHSKHEGRDREKFPRPHKKPSPAPEPENPEPPAEEENQNN